MASGKRVLVTGNGFDLYHGKKTGYKDFIGRVEEAFEKDKDACGDLDRKLAEFCNGNGFFRHFHFLAAEDASWRFFESEMSAIVGALAHFQTVLEEKQRDPEFDLLSFNLIAGIFTYQDLQVFQHFARIFEQVVDDPTGGMYKLRPSFITQERTLARRAMIDEVRRELDDFTAALDTYLAACVEETPCDVRIPALAETPPDYVINFNYTSTAALYGVPEEKIFYAKGRAGSDPLNLVLGFPDRRPGVSAPGGLWRTGPLIPRDGEGMKPAEMSPGKDRPVKNVSGQPSMPAAPDRQRADQACVGRPGMPGGMPPMPPMPGGPGRAGDLSDWLCLGNDFQSLAKGIGAPDGKALLAPVTVHYFGYSFPEGDAQLIVRLGRVPGNSIVYYTDRDDCAWKMIALMRIFGKETVEEAIRHGSWAFEPAEGMNAWS